MFWSADSGVHRRPGGVVFLLSFFSDKLQIADIRAILSASVVILIFGRWDDAKGLSAPIRLTGQILAGIILISQGIQIRTVVATLAMAYTQLGLP